MSTVTWSASGGGDWDISADWSSDPSLPGSGDAVEVATPGAATITHSQGADDSAASISLSAIDSLTVSAGSLTVAAASSIGGMLTLAGGALELDGDTTVGLLAQSVGLLSGTGTVTVSGPAVLGLSNSFVVETGSGITDLKFGGSLGGDGVSPLLGLDGGRVLENEGVFAWQSGQISLAANFLGVSVGSATIDNVVGAIFDDQTDGTINANNLGTNIFINEGTFKKSEGIGTTTITITFNNSGTAEVDSGTLALLGGGNSSGGLTAASGTTLRFDAGSYSITGTVSSPGTFQVSGAAVSVLPDLTITGLLNLTSGSLALGGNATLASLTHSGGQLSGTGTVTVASPAAFGLSNSSIVEAGSGTTDLKSGGSLGGPGFAPGLGLDGGRVLENEGVFAWKSGFIDLGDNALGVSVGGATIDNAAGGVFDAQSDFSIVTNNIGTDLFINNGTFKKSAGIGTTTITVTVNNNGTAEVDSGTLALLGGGNSSGGLTAASGTTLRFDAGSYSITGTVSSPGTFQVSGAAVSVLPDLTITGLLNLISGSLALGGNATLASLTHSGGQLSGTGTVTVASPAVFGLSNSSIVEAGPGTTDLKSGGSLGGPGFAPGLGLDGGRVLENEGVFAWKSGFIDLGDNALGLTAGGATIDNAAGAVFDAQNDFSIVTNNIGTDLFINDGTFKKSAGAGTTTIRVTLNNTGTVEADSGTLALLGEITGSGQFVIGADAQLELGSAASGAATFNGANATLRLDAPAGFTGAIDGFALGDVIDLVNTVATGVSFDGTALTVTLSSGATLDYDFTGASLDQFNLVSDGHAGTDIIITGVDHPPNTSVPGAQAIFTNETTPIPGIRIADADAFAANEFFTVTLTDTVGRLSVLGGLETGLDTNHLTIFGSLELVNLELATLTYFAGATGSDSIDIVTKDGRGGSDSHSIGVTVAAFNAPPVTTVPGPQTISPNVVSKITGVGVADADAVSAAETITVKLTDGAGALAVNSGATDGGTITGENTTVLTISGTLGQVNAYLATLTDTNSSVGGDPITVVTDDGRGASDTRMIGVTVIVAGDAPPITTVPGAQTVVQSIETKITGVSVADADAVSAAETITVKLTDGAGALAVNPGATGGGTITGGGTTALTISGTLAQINAYLATLTDSDGSVGNDTITVATDDGRGGSDAHKIGVTVTTGNAPPVTTVAGPQFFQQGDQGPIPVSVVDADAGSAGETITVALSDTTGLLSADAGAGGGGTITGSGTTTLTISGTLAQVNADLSSLDYIANGVGTDSIDVATSDGRGGSNDQQIAVSINAPPVTTVPGAQIIDLNGGSNLTPIPSVSVADADAVSASETITVTLSDTTGLLSADNGAGGGGTIAGSATTGLTIEGTLTQVNADLSTLAYVANGFGADSIDVVTSDGRGGSDSRTIGITITGSNAPPVTTVAGPQLFQQGGQGAIPISVADADADSAGETITVALSDTTGFLSANAGVGGGGGTITGSGTTKLTISGTLAQVNADLSTLDYAANGVSTDSIDVATSDSRGGGDDHQIAVSVNATPITTVPGTQMIFSNGTTPITGVSIADADAFSTNEFFTVTLTDTIGQLSVLGGFQTGLDTNHLTIFGPLDLVNLELSTLTYFAGTTGSDSIDITTSDGRGGSDSHSIGVTGATINAPPVTTVPGAQLAQFVAQPAFRMPIAISGISVADADADSAGETIQVHIDDSGGFLSVSATPGAQIVGSGSLGVHISGTLAAVNAAVSTLTYTAVRPEHNDLILINTTDSRGAVGQVASINVTINEPPVTTVPGTQTGVPNVTMNISGISVADDDGFREQFTVTLTDTSGTLAANTRAPGGGGTIAQIIPTQLTISGTLDQVNADLSTLTYLGDGSDSIDVATDDGREGRNDHHIAINAPPVTTVPGAQLAQFVAQPAFRVPIAISGISVADADADSAGETIQVHIDDSGGFLSVSATPGAQIVGSGSLGVHISGTLAAVNAAISTLTYTAVRPEHNDLILINTTDSRGAVGQVASINVTINEPPVTTVPGTQTGVPNVTMNISGISVADDDGFREQFTVTLTDTSGTLAANTRAPGGGGTITQIIPTQLTISGTLDQVNADLSTLTYLGDGSDSIDVATDDGREGRNDHHIAINAPPVTTVPGAQLAQFVAQPAFRMPIAISGISVADADADSAGETIQVHIDDSGGFLSVSATPGAQIVGSGSLGVHISGTLAAVNAAISTLTYTAVRPEHDDLILINTTDSRGAVGQVASINVTINEPPVTTVPGTQTGVPNVTMNISGISVADDDGFREQFTVTLTDTSGTLAANTRAPGGGGTIAQIIPTQLTISGTLDQVNADLSTLTYLGDGSDSIDVATDDGREGRNDHHIAINAPPVTTVPRSLLIQRGVTTAISGISIADSDAISTAETVRVVLTDTNGKLSASTTAPGGNGSVITGSGTKRLTIAGTLDQVNADLSTLTYLDKASGADSIDVATTDGRGGSNDHQIAVAINAPPVTIVPLNVKLVQQHAAAAIPGVSVADADAVSASETITVVLTDTGGFGRLSASSFVSGGGGVISGTGTTQLTIEGTLAQINADLSTLSYLGDAFGTDSIDVVTNDGRGGDDDHHVVVDVNAPPVLTVPAQQLVQVVGPIIGIRVADADGLSAGETVEVILNTFQGGLLSATPGAPVGGGTIIGVGTNVLRIIGSLAEVNADLSTLTYFAANSAFLSGLDDIAVSTIDGRGGSDGGSILVLINSPPVTVAPATMTVQQFTEMLLSPNPSDPFASLITVFNSTVNNPFEDNETITVTLTDSSGILFASQSAVHGGGTVDGSGTNNITITGTLAQVNADLTTLAYFNLGFGTDSIDVATSDGRGGSDDHHIAVSINAPVVARVPGAQTVLQGVKTTISGVSLADADAVSANETITVTLTDTAGTLSANMSGSGGGGSIKGSGTKSLSIKGTFGQVNADLSTLRYLDNSFGSDSIDIAVTDGRGGGDNRSIDVAVNAPPVTTVPGAQTVQPNVVTAIFGVTVINADAASAGEIVTVTLTDAVGALSANRFVRGGVGSAIIGSGTTELTIAGTLAQVNADLSTLTYLGNSFGTDSIDVATSDGRGGSDDHHIAVGINAPPVTTVPGAQTVQSGVRSAIDGISVADADAFGPLETITVTLTDAAGALVANKSGSGGGGTINGLGTSTLMIKGTLDQVNADLSTLQYLGRGFETDSIDVATSDGRGGGDDRTIAISVNAPPVTRIRGSLEAQQNAVTAISNVSVDDADAVSAGETITFAIRDMEAVGTLSASTTVPDGGGTITGSGTAELSIEGTLAQVNADLSTLTYLGNGFSFGTDDLREITTDSRGGTDAHFVILFVNAQPVTTVPGARTVQSGAASAIDGISVTDPELRRTEITVRLTDTAGTLSANQSSGGGGTITGSGTKTLTIKGTLDQVNADLSTLSYLVSIPGTDSIDVATSDGRGGSDDHQIAVSTVAAVRHVAALPGSGEVTTGHSVRITLDMSEPVSVSGSPILLLNDGATASFDTGRSNATALVFDFSVAPGQMTTDLAICGIQLSSPASIQGVAGTNADLSGAGADLGLRINTAGTGDAGPSGGNFSISGNQELELFGDSSASISFALGSILKLDASAHFTGQVSGFANPDLIDLSDISFGANTTLGFSVNGDNTGGALNVSDGTHIANITLLGQYTASQFAMSSDGHGGTLITDLPPGQQQFLAPPKA